jgi:hypothetical protein
MPDSVTTSQGIVQLTLTKWFGPSYRTTISGYVSMLGALIFALSPVFTGRTQQVLAIVGGLLSGTGAWRMGTYAKDKSVTDSEPK